MVRLKGIQMLPVSICINDRDFLLKEKRELQRFAEKRE